MTGDGIQARLLPDGRRLYLQHGPIDLVIEAFGAPTEIWAAYEQATAAFADVLPTLVQELALLRRPLEGITLSARLPFPLRREAGEREGTRRGSDGEGEVVFDVPAEQTHLTRSLRSHPLPPKAGGEGNNEMPPAIGPVARRMVAACWPHRAEFITPMAAVAGAVADHMLEALLEGRRLDRAYVNDGGDIAFYLAPGQQLTCGVVADLATPAIDGTIALTHDMPVRGIATSGRATRGRGGRSFSFGIADSVTVLAQDAAAADAAATLIANAVDLPGHPAILRGPASDIDPDSDLGDRTVTFDVGRLDDDEMAAALRAGAARAEALRRSGHIRGAVLVLRGRFATVGAGLPALQAA